jgi:hypothetical protein
MSWVAIGVSVGGAVAGTAGNAITAGSANQAARRAGDDNVRDLRGQQGSFGSGVFGPSYGQQPTNQFLYGQGIERQDQGMIDQALAGMNQFTQSQGGPVMDQLRQLAESVSQRQTGNLGRFDTDTQNLGQFSAQTGNNLGNFMGQSRDDLLRGYDQGSANILGDYDRGAANITRGAQGAELMARDWGRGNADRIRRESIRDLDAANRQTTRGLNSRGLGNSTVLNQAQASNRQRVLEQRNNAMQDNNNQQIDRQLGTRSQTLGLQQGLHNQRAGMQQGLHNQRAGFQYGSNNAIADAMRQLGESQIGREYQRSSDRMGLENANLTRDIGMRQDPINLMYQTLQSGIMNPYGYQNQPVPAASASGAALNTAGNMLGAAGGYMLGNANRPGQQVQQPNAQNRQAFNDYADWANFGFGMG